MMHSTDSSQGTHGQGAGKWCPGFDPRRSPEEAERAFPLAQRYVCAAALVPS